MSKYLLILGLLLGVSVSNGQATTWWFSNCATGGSGTQADPFCLKPTGADRNLSVMWLFNGTAPEAATGDSIFLCCGGTGGCQDARSSCTYHVDCTTTAPYSEGGSVWFMPNKDGPITIQGWDDDVTISGDRNGNGVADNGSEGPSTCVVGQDVSSALWASFSTSASRRNYTWSNINFDKWSRNFFGDDNFGGIGWAFQNVTIDEIGGAAWGVTTGIGSIAACDYRVIDGPPFGFYLWGGGSGTNTQNVFLLNVTLKRVCGFGLRDILGGHGTNGTVKILNSTFEDMSQVANVWGSWSWATNQGQHFTFQGNQVKGFGSGLALENQNKGAQIIGNTFTCPEAYNENVSPFAHECRLPITINQGDYAGQRNGANADHRIEQNIIYGMRAAGDSASLNGWMRDGIVYRDSCRVNSECTGVGTPWCCCLSAGNGTCNSSSSGTSCSTGTGIDDYRYGCGGGAYLDAIVNNVIYSIARNESDSAPGFNAIDITRNSSIYVENNTIYGAKESGISLTSGVSTGDSASDLTTGSAIQTTFALDNNIVSSSGGAEVSVAANTTAQLRNDNLYDGTGNILAISGGASYTCADIATINTLGNNCAGVDPSCNVCSAPSYKNVSGTKDTWDFHIPVTGPDYNVSNFGPPVDYELQPRPFDPTNISLTPYDRGADELRSPLLAISLPVTHVSSGGNICDASNGDTVTIDLNYSNSIGADTAHNAILHINSVGTVGNHLTYASTTCVASAASTGSGVDFTLGTFQAGQGESCTVTFSCVHTAGGANGNTIFGYFQADEVPVSAGAGSTGDPLTTFFPPVVVQQ